MRVDSVFSLLSGTAAVFLSLIFGQSAVWKIADMDAFVATVNTYQLIPPATGRLASQGLLIAELLVVVTILIPRTRSGGALLAITLLLVYAAAMTINLQRGRHYIDCGCGGTREAISYALILRNGFLASIALAALAAPCVALAQNAVALVSVSGITLWLGWTVAEQIHANSTLLDRRQEGSS